jgi:hypothetical protein
LLTANKKLLTRLKRAGSIVALIYREGGSRELSFWVDRQRYPGFAPERFLQAVDATATPETKAQMDRLRQFERIQ